VRYILTPIGRRLLAAKLAPWDDAEADPCPFEDEQVQEDEHYLEDEQVDVLRLLVDWRPGAPAEFEAIAAHLPPTCMTRPASRT
jgi:hypothetical protein